jgi:subtilase family serine protease
MRPAVTNVPFTGISDAAARVAQQTPFCATVGLVCYSPSHLKAAYNFPTDRKAPTGAGQTIVIVEAYGSGPYGASVADDLAQFDAENGLPAPPSFKIVTQQTPVSDQGSGDILTWAIETSLDVQYAHAMAPGANIVLAIADTDDSANLAQIEKEVLASRPLRRAIVSQSFGADETGELSDPVAIQTFQSLYLRQVLSGGTVVASSGDFGASNLGPLYGLDPAPMAGYPASSPYVLAVGGTMGNPAAGGLWNNGRYGGEQAWNELLPTVYPGAGASGGAPSVVYKAPPWQWGLTGTTMRAEPDVSLNAANNGGVVIVLKGRHGVMGGTSAAAPQWAAIVALANEQRGKQGRLPLGIATPQLYAIARDRRAYAQDFHDITLGNNALFGDLYGFPGFSAKAGYDYPTGLGTPNVSKLLSDLSSGDSRGGDSGDNGDFGGNQQNGGQQGANGHGRVRLKPGG